jgi:hypothetical protein
LHLFGKVFVEVQSSVAMVEHQYIAVNPHPKKFWQLREQLNEMAVTLRAFEDRTPFNSTIEHMVPAFPYSVGLAVPSSDHWSNAFFRSRRNVVC